MPLRRDSRRHKRLIPLPTGWRSGFQRTGYTTEDYVDLGERVENV